MDPLMAEDEEGAALDEKKLLLEELMQFAKGGMAKDMAARHGKLPPAPPEAAAEGAPPEAAAEGQEPIPGVDDVPPEGGEAPPAESGPDIEAIKALLAQMKAR